MSTTTYLRTRVDRTPLVPILFVGDVVAVGAFAAVGVVHHGGSVPGAPARVAWATAPFLLAWASVAFLGGLYTVDAITSPRRAASWTVPAWVVAALIAQALRASGVFPGGAAPVFVLVSLVAGGALVVGWRVLASLAAGRR